MPDASFRSVQRRLEVLVRAIKIVGPELAVFLVYDRPSRATERPGLERAFFTQRCVSDERLRQTIDAFRSIGAYVQLFEGERPFIGALADGTIAAISRKFKVAYNGIEGSIAHDAFQPGRKALIPSVADSYEITCANSNAYACALGRHKFHYLTVLASLGLPVPKTWHYRLERGWAGGRQPTTGMKVIAKSTYESWSVGVTDASVFTVGGDCTEQVANIAEEIGQAVTVQEFISGEEICVPVFSAPERFTTPPVAAVLAKAPNDPDAVMTVDDNLARGGVTYRLLADDRLSELVGGLAIAAFDSLELDSFARIDFRVDQAGRPFIFDVGVSPGISANSSSFVSVASLGLDHADFLIAVVSASLVGRGILL